MSLLNMVVKFLLWSNVMNQHYINRYNNFIEQCKLANRVTEQYEKHHIVPHSMGGSDDENNIILLTPREHYIAHWILAHAYGGKMWYAFWMMNTDTRYKHYRYKNSRGYAKARIEQKELVSKNMKGYVTCYDSLLNKNVHISVEEFHNNPERYIHVSKGKATYVYNGKNIQLATDDPLVLNGEAVSIRQNYKHTDTTKQKMSENGIKGKIAIHNIETGKVKYIEPNNTLPDGYEYGYCEADREKLKERNSKLFKIFKWITNGIENKRIKILDESDIPKGWHIGRTLQTKTCEWCGKTVDIANFAQYHGKNCKQYKQEDDL